MPQQKEITEKGERAVNTKFYREFKGVYTKNARVSIPQENFYDLVNLMPIGQANLHSVSPPSQALASYGNDTIYWAQYANILSVDYIISFATTGKVFAYNIGTGISQQINAGNLLSGAGSRFDQWKNQNLLFIDSNGYFYWDGGTFAPVPSSGSILPTFPASGTYDIAVFSNRVWLYKNRVLYVSGLNDFTGTAITGGYQVVNGAVVQLITDPQARGELVRQLSANGYLYLFFKSSIFIISDVYVPTGAIPPFPLFTLLNIQANIGSDQPGSIFAVDRDLLFANRYGLWALRGVTTERISSEIDGTIQYLDFTKAISGGSATVRNIQNAGFLINQLNDPAIGTRTVLAMYFDKKWWFANVGAASFICQAIVNNTPVLFAFIGNQLYQLFVPVPAGMVANGPITFISNDAILGPLNFVSQGGGLQFQTAGSNINFQSVTNANAVLQFTSGGINLNFVSGSQQSLAASWQTALWPMEDQLRFKEVFRVGYEITSANIDVVSFNVDTQANSYPVNIKSVVGALTFIGAGGQAIQFQTAGVNLNFTSNTYGLFFADAGGIYGKYVGISGSTLAGPDFELSSFEMDYELGQRW